MSVDWRQRWDEGRTGFHLADVNPWLRRFAGRCLEAKAHVFVPLCGKTLDLRWLSERGHRVTAVELSSTAVREFHAETGLDPSVEERGAMRRHRSAVAELYEGDYFDLDPAAVGPFDAVWDRAALIAVERAQRPAYVARMRAMLRPGGAVLLVSLRYDAARMKGPPFSVGDEEVRALFADGWRLEELAVEDALEASPRFRARGLERLDEAVYHITRDEEVA